jgi:hypothetical protein|tara:strand:- start:380 stop:817 length:438 start_codon:yes stop_codon:yes gene_type:complete
MYDLIQIKAVVEDSYDNIDISTTTRKMPYPDAVKVFCYIANKCLKKMKYSRRVIGKYINRDHSSISYNIKKCENLMQVDDDFRDRVRFCMHLSVNILNKETCTYKDKIDVVFTKLSNSQQEQLYRDASIMYAFNTNLKEEVDYVE